MPVSKSVRFEVFARDLFTCQYCGQRPPDVVLEVDHIHPRSKGGSDEIVNLITSCFDCNRGKRAKVLSGVAPRPDADLALLRTQQEIVEVQRFLEAKKVKDELEEELCEALREVWAKYLTKEVPANVVFLPWIAKYGAEEVSESIAAASIPFMRGQFGYGRCFSKLLRYVGGILRNRSNRSAGLPDKGVV